MQDFLFKIESDSGGLFQMKVTTDNFLFKTES